MVRHLFRRAYEAGAQAAVRNAVVLERYLGLQLRALDEVLIAGITAGARAYIGYPGEQPFTRDSEVGTRGAAWSAKRRILIVALAMSALLAVAGIAAYFTGQSGPRHEGTTPSATDRMRAGSTPGLAPT